MPTEKSFRTAFWHLSTNERVTVCYTFEKKNDWEADNYVTDEVFESNETLTNITIPDGVTAIGDEAFFLCHNLTSIVIPDGVTSIGNKAFEFCGSLTSIAIPDSVTSIGERAFSSCSSLTSIVVPDSVTSIDSYAFNDCRSLTSITIPDSVTRIEGEAFYGCSSLTSIVVPDSVTSIGWSAFKGCRNLTSITIPDSVTSIGYWTFEDCSSLTSIVVPDSVTSIGWSAFKGCHSLMSIVIPDSVTSIDNEAFAGCEKLSTFIVKKQSCKFGRGIFGDAVPSGLLPHIGELFAHFSDGDLKAYVMNARVWNTLNIDVQAAIFMVRQGKTLMPLYAELVCDSEELGNALLDRLPEKPSVKECKAIANFMTMFSVNMTAELLTRMYEALKPLKTATKALEAIQADRVLMERLSTDMLLS